MDMAQSYLVDSNWKLSVGSFAQYRQNLSVGVSPEPLKTDDQSSRNSSELQTCETFRLRRILEGICQDGLLNCPFDYSHSGSHSIQLEFSTCLVNHLPCTKFLYVSWTCHDRNTTASKHMELSYILNMWSRTHLNPSHLGDHVLKFESLTCILISTAHLYFCFGPDSRVASRVSQVSATGGAWCTMWKSLGCPTDLERHETPDQLLVTSALLVVTSATLVVTSALLVVTRSY